MLYNWYMSVSSDIELYDSDIAQIDVVLQRLSEKSGTRMNYNHFENEVRDRFSSIGFTTNVNWYTYTVDGKPGEGAMPEITITGRTDPAFTFDPDRQVHEVVNNYLDIPGEEKGRTIKSGEFLRAEEHKHSNG